MSIEARLARHFWPVFGGLFLAVIGWSLWMRNVFPTDRKPVPFVPAPEYVERLSGTFRAPLAQSFYMKGVLEIAQQQASKLDQLFALFRLAMRLDPRLVNAAFFGGIVTPVTVADLPRAIELLREAEQLNPTEWRIPYWIGFCYLEMEEYDQAAAYYKKASELPGALPFLKFATVHLLSRGSALERALQRTEELLASVDDPDSREFVLARQQWLKHMLALEEKNREFRARFGRWPDRLEELIERGLLPALPPDEFGEGFELAFPGDPDKGYRVRSRLGGL